MRRRSKGRKGRKKRGIRGGEGQAKGREGRWGGGGLNAGDRTAERGRGKVEERGEGNDCVRG